jgi:hypothetical protein
MKKFVFSPNFAPCPGTHWQYAVWRIREISENFYTQLFKFAIVVQEIHRHAAPCFKCLLTVFQFND